MEWKLVNHSRTRKPIGAIGFIEGKVAVVNTFYADKDWDHDGQVSHIERFGSMFGLGGKSAVDVLRHAIDDPNLYMKDPNGFRQLNSSAITQFATGMILEGIYITYMKMAVGQSCGAIAGNLVNNSAAQFFIRKGMEHAVKQAYSAATR